MRNTGAGTDKLSKSIVMRYFFSIMGYLLILLGGYFVAYLLATRRVWYKDDPLYVFLKILQSLSPIILLVLSLVGFYFITRHFLRVPLRYLNELTEAAKQLAAFDGKPIMLSAALLDTQNELNLVREQALRNERAAKEAEQRKNDLIVYLAHDLKTPLTSVIGYLTLLRDEPNISLETRAKYTGIALGKAERLEELVNEFFEITRFNLSHMELNLQTVSLSRMLEQTASEYEPVLTEKGLQIEGKIEPEVNVLCDPDKLARVFDNMLRNAVSYSYPQTPIYIVLESCDGYAIVSVKNHGKTIPQEKLQRIFEQFFRADASRASQSGGSGLGLAIAKEIVELHGGSIAASSVDETITVTVTLPVRKS